MDDFRRWYPAGIEMKSARLSLDLAVHPHKRLNPMTGEWVLVSPHRTQRPWQGQVEAAGAEAAVTFDPNCYLCPGNTRVGGVKNPDYRETFVFDNDFAALRPETPEGVVDASGLLVAHSEVGRCRVVCFSPRHDLTMARMSSAELLAVIDAWANETQELGSDPRVACVQVFENRGEMMGCSNPHPHGQIWANGTLPNELAKEARAFEGHFRSHTATLLGDYLEVEQKKNERIVAANEHFVLLVPFWAVWPFETLLVSRRPVASIPQLTQEERMALADILRQTTIRYDNLFQAPFPYTMGFHQAPTDDKKHSEFHLHAHFYPPLLRSATVKKFMVGYEMLAMPQRDITPEAAAIRLRELPAKHYLEVS
jgi:UDPglucose--hexose-1-phosphate uridylyltransferase